MKRLSQVLETRNHTNSTAANDREAHQNAKKRLAVENTAEIMAQNCG